MVSNSALFLNEIKFMNFLVTANGSAVDLERTAGASFDSSRITSLVAQGKLLQCFYYELHSHIT